MTLIHAVKAQIRPMISNLSITILCHWEVVFLETMIAELFPGTIVVFVYFFTQKVTSKKRWSLSSPHNLTRRRPPAKIANAMTILAQLLRANNFWNLVFKSLWFCLRFNEHAAFNGILENSGLLLNIQVQNSSPIDSGPFIRHVLWICKPTAFYAGPSVFVLRLDEKTRQFSWNFLF